VKCDEYNQRHGSAIQQKSFDGLNPRTQFFFVGVAQEFVHENDVKGVNKHRDKTFQDISDVGFAR
jgi:hypothetical protein